ncbi:hypothetical protein O97_01384 [Bartonella henselae str. Zeus]|nr:hypothetical protein Q653_01486 [Bartonella henselae JK 42]ETS12118.1 hypothetical protein Q652_01461 [Bartonella henselae JK 41]KEC56417.1 hypothetical protein O97_01384 [Bartonella henselae str. Zeus]KEC59119.1 hypothetical protein O95_01362 [Bartonella henselae JK 53]
MRRVSHVPCVGFGVGIMDLPIVLLMMIGCLADPFAMEMMGVYCSIVMLAALLERSYKHS